jgi:hypothetical protein
MTPYAPIVLRFWCEFDEETERWITIDFSYPAFMWYQLWRD